MKEKPTVRFRSRHETGNIYCILATVRSIMRKERRITDYNNMWSAVETSGSYEDALREIGKYVHLIDEDTGREYGK